MLFIFPLIYIVSFFIAFREIIKGNRGDILIFIIIGLPMYVTAMSVSFMIGLKSFIPFFQFFKEFIVLTTFTLCVINLKHRVKLHLVDYCMLAFFLYTLLYAILPIGEQGIFNRFVSLKSTSFFVIVYFVGRLIDLRTLYISKYFNYILLLTIAVGAIVLVEVFFNQQLQTITGYADYNYYFFNFEPSGIYGLSTTFESEGGYRRFASLFSTPLEHANATWLALCIILALFTHDDNKFKLTTSGILGLLASFISIIFALSRAPLISYCIVIYVYALITKKKRITHAVHVIAVVVAIYLIYLLTKFEQNNLGITEVIVNTLDFSNPSSVGHLVQWVEGILSIVAHPLGLGLGTSGRVAASVSENVGGENQYIIIGVQVGVIALFMYMFVYFKLLKMSIKWVSKLQGKERQICMAILLIRVGLFIPLLTSEVEAASYITYITWFLSGLFVSIVMNPTNVTPTQLVYD